jgi:RNA polymerase sigma-70 factor (ECF subfamily)
MDPTPPSLLEQLRRPGGEAAWAAFVDLYAPLLCHWARGLGLHGAEAADLVENAFAVVANNLHQFRHDQGQSFRNWLWTLSLDVLHSRRRLATGHQAREAEIDTVPMAAQPGALGKNEYRQYLIQRTPELIRGDLEPASWKAFCKFAMSGQPVDEVARELGMSVGDVYLAKARVLRRVHSYLAGLLE